MTTIEKESQVIGFLILTPTYFPETLKTLKAEHFLDENFRRIYEIQTEAFRNSQILDEVLLAEKFGNASFIDKLISENNLTSTSFLQYVKDVKQAYNDRSTIKNADLLKEAIIDKNYSEAETARQNLFQPDKNTEFHSQKISDLADEFLEDYFSEKEKGIKTGIKQLDKLTSGFKNGNFITISARTGIGKTNLCLNMALTMAKAGKKVLFISLEMLASELMDRLIGLSGQVNAAEVRERMLEQNALTLILADLKKLPIKMIFGADLTTLDVFTAAYSEKVSDGLDVLFVDYLGRLADQMKTSEEEKLSRIARSLKNTALKLEIPVISPVQIDKSSALSKKSPEVEDAKGSTTIGHESDIGLAITREDKYSPKTKLYIVKNRHGGLGIIDLMFNMKTLEFSEIEEEQKEEAIEATKEIPESKTDEEDIPF